jgi:hypothetical protein
MLQSAFPASPLIDISFFGRIFCFELETGIILRIRSYPVWRNKTPIREGFALT